MEIDPWRNKNKVRVISVIDASIGVFLILLYIYYGIAFMVGGENLPRGAMGVAEARLLASSLAIAVLAVNSLQVFIAVKLFKAVKPAEARERKCIRFAQIWFNGNIFFFILLFVKFFVLLLFNFGSSNTVDFIFLSVEFFFRSIGWYFIKEFIDDLKAEFSQRLPTTSTFSTIPLSTEGPTEDAQN